MVDFDIRYDKNILDRRANLLRSTVKIENLSRHWNFFDLFYNIKWFIVHQDEENLERDFVGYNKDLWEESGFRSIGIRQIDYACIRSVQFIVWNIFYSYSYYNYYTNRWIFFIYSWLSLCWKKCFQIINQSYEILEYVRLILRCHFNKLFLHLPCQLAPHHWKYTTDVWSKKIFVLIKNIINLFSHVRKNKKERKKKKTYFHNDWKKKEKKMFVMFWLVPIAFFTTCSPRYKESILNCVIWHVILILTDRLPPSFCV